MSDPKDEQTLGRPAGGGGEKQDAGLPLGSEVAGRYRVLELLGRGGMGVVYRARDLTLDADVALKALPPEVIRDPVRIASFRNEVRVARMVTHPNVCRIHDIVETDAGSFITMDFIEGDTLAMRLAGLGGKAPVPWALKVLRDVARGLAAAHAAGVVHRDLKPSNVILGEKDRAMVTDFGVAARLGPEPARMAVAGTQGYMSPEQASGAPLDARSDVYALGVLAYRMVAGSLPTVPPAQIDASSADSLSPTSAGSGPPLHIAADAIRARMPPELADFVVTCMEPDPDSRPADASVALRMLSGIATLPGESADATRISGSFPAAPPAAIAAPRRRMLAAAGVAVAALIGAGWFGRGYLAPSGPPVIAVEAFQASGLPEGESWIAAAIQRLLITELIDAWSIDARAAGVDASSPPTIAVAGNAARTEAGKLHLTVRVRTAFKGTRIHDIEGGSPNDLAEALARRIVQDGVPEGLRHPTARELALAGTEDAEAWRLWRRSQTDARMLRWRGVTDRCEEALQRDPEFTLAWMEMAFSYNRSDRASADALQQARFFAARTPGLDPVWVRAIEAADALIRKDTATAAKIVEEVRKEDLDDRVRLYIDTRWAYAIFFDGQQELAAPLLEQISEKWPNDAAAFKMLADFHLASGDPASLKLALRNGERAVALAPYDLASRAILARALLASGDEKAAREHDRILSGGSSDEKRSAGGALFDLHMAMGEVGEASVDGRRFLTGSETDHLVGLSRLAFVDFHRGAWQSGFAKLEEASTEADRLGSSTRAAYYRMSHASVLLGLGEYREAIAIAALAGAVEPSHPEAEALSGVAAHRMGGGAAALARARAGIASAGLPADDPGRIALEVLVAHEAGEWEKVIAGFTAIRDRASTVPVLFVAADAYEKTGRSDEAIRLFEQLARHPDGWKREPVQSVRAMYRAALLKEKSGDGAGAAEAYDRFLARWGRATRDLPEIREARAKLDVLRQKYPATPRTP